jgi:hypothetical protein
MRGTGGYLIAVVLLATCAALVQGQSSGQKRSPAVAPVQQQLDVRRCPDLSVEALQEGAANDATLKFRVLLEGMKVRTNLSFNWTITSGVITAGQNEPTVTIDAPGAQRPDEFATVTIGGLPSHCPATASAYFLPPPPLLCYSPFDSYGVLDPEDEAARLDNFAVALENDPKATGYLIFYGGRRGRRGEALAGLHRAQLYLVNTRGVDVGRIVSVEGGYREELTFELFLIPPGVVPPRAAPTIDERDVEFIDRPF